MEAQMSKARLLQMMRHVRSDWDALLASFSKEQLVAVSADGEWSIKDIVAHITAYDRWLRDRLEEQLHGQPYTPTELDELDFDERNARLFELNRHRPLAEVLQESREVYQQLLATVEALPEAFLMQPQRFEGLPFEITPWKYLRSESYGHYEEHMPAVRAKLAQRRKKKQS